MKKLHKIIVAIVIGLTITGITTASLPQYWKTIDSLIPRTDRAVDIGSPDKYIREIFVDVLNASSTAGFSNWQFTGSNAITPTTTVGLIVNASSTFLHNVSMGTTSAPTMFIDSQNGRVGIGTGSPNESLEVVGDIQGDTDLNLTASNSVVKFTFFGGTIGDGIIKAPAVWEIVIDSNNNSSNAKFFITKDNLGTELFRVQEDGNVGINQEGPDRKLDILDATNAQLRLTHTDGSVFTDFKNNSGGDLIISPSGGSIRIDVTGGQDAFTIRDLSGSSDVFVVSTSNNSIQTNLIMGNLLNNTNVNVKFISEQYGSTAEPEGYTIFGGNSISGSNNITFGGGFGNFNSATNLGFYTGTTVSTLGGILRMTIDSSGNIGIATSTPANKLSVVGGASIGSISWGETAPTNGLIVEGRVGIGTEAPAASAKLHVSGGDIFNTDDGNSPRYVLGDTTGAGRYGSINWNSAGDYLHLGTNTGGEDVLVLTESGFIGIATTTPEFTLTVDGDVLITGDLDFDTAGSGLIFGSIYQHETMEVVPIEQNVYIPIGGFISGLSNNMILTTSTINIIVSGVYKIDWSISSSMASVNQDVDIDIFVNAVEQDDGASRRMFGTGGDIGNIGASAILSLNAGDKIGLQVKNITSGSNMTIQSANFNVTKIGGN